MKNNNLLKLLASYYGMYVKIHSYHWNVTGGNFVSLHKMLEEQYETIADEIDEIAEKIRMYGQKVPVSLQLFSSLSIISNPNENFNDIEMITDLYESNKLLISFLKDITKEYENDITTIDMLTTMLSTREKDSWFLLSTVSR